MTTNQTTIHTRTIPPIGYVGADDSGAYVVTGHTDAGAIIERQDGTTKTIAPADYPPLPKPGTAAYRIAQVLTRDRSWLDGYTQSVIEPSIDVEDDADQERELLREFPPTIAALMQIGAATRAGLCTEAIILRAGLIETLAAHGCADADDSATGFELIGALRTWLDAGRDAQDNADFWQDEVARQIFDAWRAATGNRWGNPKQERDAIIAYLKTNIVPQTASTDTSPQGKTLAEELVGFIRDAAKAPPAPAAALPLDAEVDGVRVSPFYLAEQRGWTYMQSLDAATKAVSATVGTESVEQYDKMLKHCWDGWHDIAAELNNMDAEFQGGAA